MTPVLVNTLRRWNATVLGETQHSGGHVLVREALADQLRDLQLHRRQVQQCRRVTLAGGLARRPELAAGAVRERLCVQVLEGLQRGPQMGAGVHAALRPTQELAVRELDPRPVVRPVRSGVVGQGPFEQLARAPESAVIARPKSAAACAHGSAVPAVNESRSCTHATGLVPVIGPDRGVDAFLGGHQRQGGQPHLAELVQRAGRIPGRAPPGCPRAQRARSSTGRARMPGAGFSATRASRAARRSSKSGLPSRAARSASHASGAVVRRALADAVSECDGFLRGAAQGSPPAGDEQPERESLEGVQDGHAVAVLPGRRQHEGVAASVCVVVAQVEGRVPEVPEQVEVRHRPVGVRTPVRGQVDRGGELLAGRGPVACDVVQACWPGAA